MSLEIKIEFRLEILKFMIIQNLLIMETERQVKGAYEQYWTPFFEQSLVKSLQEYNQRFCSNPQQEEIVQIIEPDPVPDPVPDLLEKKTQQVNNLQREVKDLKLYFIIFGVFVVLI